MRSVYIKMILILLTLSVSEVSVAAEFASPDAEEEYIPVITDIVNLFRGRQEIILPAEEEPVPRYRVRRAPRPAPRARASQLVVVPERRVSRRQEVRTPARPAPRVRGGYCEGLRPRVSSIVGAAHASCYLKLFSVESGCRWNLPQAAGNAGNPYAAYGLCSIERSPAIRRLNRRGAACSDISSFDNQVRCCQSMMRKTPHYFGPVIHGKVPRCG